MNKIQVVSINLKRLEGYEEFTCITAEPLWETSDKVIQ